MTYKSRVPLPCRGAFLFYVLTLCIRPAKVVVSLRVSDSSEPLLLENTMSTISCAGSNDDNIDLYKYKKEMKGEKMKELFLKLSF